MKRKVNLVGTNTLTVSLPTAWATERGIKKGDELNVSWNDEQVVYSAQEEVKAKKSITLNIDGYNYVSLSAQLSTFYCMGYTSIILLHPSQKIYVYKSGGEVEAGPLIRKGTARFIGAEIVSQTPQRTEIECLVQGEPMDLDKIEMRIGFLFKEVLAELLTCVGPHFKQFCAQSYDKHDVITKFINYFKRELYSSNRSVEEKRTAYAFYSFVDMMVDQFRHICEKIDRFGCTPKCKRYLAEVFAYFNDILSARKKGFAHDIEKQKELIKRRYDLKRRVDEENFSTKELQVLREAMFFTEVLSPFASYVMSKGLQEGSHFV